MAYLQFVDYTLRIALNNLTEILTEGSDNSGLTNEEVRANAEVWAQEYMKSYLSNKYDIASEFAKTSDTPEPRNRQIMQVLIDLTLCTLHKTINPRDIPDHVSNSCTEAKNWLIEARDGLVIVDLPPRTLAAGEQEYDVTYLGSQPKFISKAFTDLSLLDNE